MKYKIGQLVYRQGDVPLIYAGDKKPTGKPASKNKITLRWGEATGHAHVIEGAVAEFEVGGQRMIWVEAPALYHHPDHSPAIDVDLGLWVVGEQLEYSPQSIRRVID